MNIDKDGSINNSIENTNQSVDAPVGLENFVFISEDLFPKVNDTGALSEESQSLLAKIGLEKFWKEGRASRKYMELIPSGLPQDIGLRLAKLLHEANAISLDADSELKKRARQLCDEGIRATDWLMEKRMSSRYFSHSKEFASDLLLDTKNLCGLLEHGIWALKKLNEERQIAAQALPKTKLERSGLWRSTSLFSDTNIGEIRRHLYSTIKSWLPSCQESGCGRYLALNPFRDDKNLGSFYIFPNGRAYDFATKERYDTIDLWAAVKDLKLGEALKALAEDRGILPAITRAHTPAKVAPNVPPANFPEPREEFFVHPKHGKPSQVYCYKNLQGKTIGFVARYDTPAQERKKHFCPVSFTHDVQSRPIWKKSIEGWNGIVPIYGLENLKARPDAPILIVEGEKTVAAAAKLFPDHIVLTWQGGSSNPGKADWSQLAGRTVEFIWPDADQKRDKKTGKLLPIHCQPAMQAALKVASALASIGLNLKIIMPPEGVEDGWDLADALDEGWTERQVQLHAKENAVDPQTLVPTGSIPGVESSQSDVRGFKRIAASPLEVAEKVWAFLEDNSPDVDLEPFKEILEQSKSSAQLLAATLRTINQYQFLKEATLIEALLCRGFSNSVIQTQKIRSRDEDDPMPLAEIVSSIEDATGKTLRWNIVLYRLEGNGDPLNEQDINQIVGICREKQRKYGKEMGMKSIVLDAMYSSQVPTYHPVKEYLQKAKAVYLATPDQNPFTEIFHRTHFRNDEDRNWFILCLRAWLIGAVCRVYNGFQNPCLTFIGTQGIGKGTFASALAKNFKDYFASRRLYNITKDDEIALGEIFIWDIDEIDSTISSVDIGTLKSFITKPKVTVRRPYDRATSRIDPITSFIGSTNQDYFLQDQTGNRRFYSVMVESFDFNWFREIFNPDTLWGWAMAEAEKVKFRPQFDDSFRTEQAARNEFHRIQDPIELLIEKLIEPDPHGQISNNQLTTLLMRLNNPIAQNMVRGKGWNKTLAAITKLGGKIHRTGKCRGFQGVRISRDWNMEQ
jgi:hypothetical protein